MYGKLFETADSFFKPINDLLAINAQALDAMREKQVDLVNEVMADSIEYAKGIAKPSLDMDTFVATQQNYWQGLQTKISSSAQDNYDLIADVQGKMGDLLQEVFDSSVLENPFAEDVAVDAKPAVKKKSPAKKASAKAAALKPDTAKEAKPRAAKTTSAPKANGVKA